MHAELTLRLTGKSSIGCRTDPWELGLSHKCVGMDGKPPPAKVSSSHLGEGWYCKCLAKKLALSWGMSALQLKNGGWTMPADLGSWGCLIAV